MADIGKKEGKTKMQKFEYLENEKSFLDETKKHFSWFLNVYHLVNKIMIKALSTSFKLLIFYFLFIFFFELLQKRSVQYCVSMVGITFLNKCEKILQISGCVMPLLGAQILAIMHTTLCILISVITETEKKSIKLRWEKGKFYWLSNKFDFYQKDCGNWV